VSVKVFLSAVSDEFGDYRDQLRSDLTRHNVEVKVQEDFKDYGGVTLDKLDLYIKACDAVVHLVGDMAGSIAKPASIKWIVGKHPEIAEKLPPLLEPLEKAVGISYTQWEAWLALYHGKLLFIAKADATAPRGAKYVPTEASRASQQAHLQRLSAIERYPGCTFTNPADLAKHIAYTAILDLLVKAYGEEVAHARDVAEGFIQEMAKRVASDRNLDFEGMKLAVRNAIDIYEREIARAQTQTNIDLIVDKALANARSLLDLGKSGLAGATLRKAAEAMRREEEERREQYVAGITVLYNRARDIGLAAYDGAAAAEAIVTLVESIYETNPAMVAQSLESEATTLYEYGRDHGSNVHLRALIELRRKLLNNVSSDDERGIANNNLGRALWTLGQRESDTERLDEAVAAYRDALQVRTRERVPLDWAQTQNNLGVALASLGERESGTAHLDEAVTAFRDALQERTRELVPLDWAQTQNNLGLALWRLSERDRDTALLEQAVAAYREVLKERTRERVPLDWAMTQNNLGNALLTLGRRESGTARLDEAVSAFRDALKEYIRERVPLYWASTQNNLGVALASLGERESGTAHLDEAVTAYRDALKERTRERVPLDWAMTQNNLGTALRMLGERESGGVRFDEAVTAHRDALKEYTRGRMPLEWAMTQNNLGTALLTLGWRENRTAQLEEAVAAYREALKERTRERVPLEWAMTQHNLGNAFLALGEREKDTGRLDEAVTAYREALKERTRERVPLDWASSLGNEGVALIRLAERRKDAAMAETALSQIITAFEMMRDDGHVRRAKYYESLLPEARAAVARLGGNEMQSATCSLLIPWSQ
jgi:tetratricopeptide (TPR) repeat protein